jgi:hypothetical protein
LSGRRHRLKRHSDLQARHSQRRRKTGSASTAPDPFIWFEDGLRRDPKRVYGSRNTAPQPRMGNVAGYRRAWQAASEYRDSLRRWKAAGSDPEKRPVRNLQLETLAGVAGRFNQRLRP